MKIKTSPYLLALGSLALWPNLVAHAGLTSTVMPVPCDTQQTTDKCTIGLRSCATVTHSVESLIQSNLDTLLSYHLRGDDIILGSPAENPELGKVPVPINVMSAS